MIKLMIEMINSRLPHLMLLSNAFQSYWFHLGKLKLFSIFILKLSSLHIPNKMSLLLGTFSSKTLSLLFIINVTFSSEELSLLVH